MPTAIHKALIYRLIEEGWNEGNLEVVDQMTAPDAVMHDAVLHHNHHHPGHDHARPVGSEAGKRFVTAYRAAFPDLQFTIDDLVAEDDIVVARWQGQGTHEGEMLGIGPTGRRATVQGTSVFRFDHAAITETWVHLEAEKLIEQLGARERPTPDRARQRVTSKG